MSGGGSFLLPSLSPRPDDAKTLLAARLLVSLPLGRVASFFRSASAPLAVFSPQFRADQAAFPRQALPIIRQKQGEPRMPQAPQPAPAKGAKPAPTPPDPVRFDDWASI